MNKEVEQIVKKIDFENIEKHPNILIAARFWDDKRYHAAKVCYKFMRMIDDFIDDRKAKEGEISCLEKDELSEKVNSWMECLDQAPEDDPFFMELAETLLRFKIPLRIFRNFARSMLYDINNDGFYTIDDFISYSEGASVAPASVFVHLCCLSEENSEYIVPDFDVIEVARPCAIFSYLVHIIRDFQEDQLNNLNYFAADILKRNNLLPSDLRIIAQGGAVTDSFRNLIGEYYNLARIYADKTLLVMQHLTKKLNSQNMLSLHIIFNLYKMVFDRIDIEYGTFTSEELNPAPGEIRDKVIEIASGLTDAR